MRFARFQPLYTYNPGADQGLSASGAVVTRPERIDY